MIQNAHDDRLPATPRLEGVRVLFTLPSLGLGGAERQALLLARRLREREGADVHFVALNNAVLDEVTEVITKLGMTWEVFDLEHRSGGLLTKVKDLLRFARLLRRRRIQVVLPYCMFPNVFCALTWRLGGASTCIWSQRDEGRQRQPRWIEGVALGQTPMFVSNSLHGAEFLEKTLGVGRERIHIVHNGVDLQPPQLDRQAWRERLGLGPNDFVACMAANFHRYKDHGTLIAAWREVVDRLQARGRAAHLVLPGGEGPTTPAVKEQIAARGLERFVHLPGIVTDITGLLGALDLVVFSSHAEGVPNAILEAMASGLAVVATDDPGVREALGSEAAALVVRPRDPLDFAAKVVRAAEDQKLTARLGEAGRRRAAEEFAPDRMTGAMVSLILGQLARSNHAARFV